MEPSQARPVRRRRRWLVVAFALVLVSLVTWWHWPRGDARFPGKWGWWMGSPATMTVIMRFDANGSGAVFDEKGKRLCPLPWTVEGDNLVVGYRPKLVQDLLAEIGTKTYGVLGMAVFYPDPLMRAQIVTADHERIVLSDATFGEVSLRRLPE